MHRRISFPSETDRKPHIKLPRRLAGSSQIRTGIGCLQRAVTQPLRVPWVDDQPAEESFVTQTAGCLSGNDLRLCPNAGMDYTGTIPDYSAVSLKLGTIRPLKVFQRLLGLMAPASSIIPLGLLHMRPLQLAQSPCSIPYLAPGAVLHQGKPSLCQSCGPLDNLLPVSSRRGVGTALCDGIEGVSGAL